jgi:hypothetical protein
MSISTYSSMHRESVGIGHRLAIGIAMLCLLVQAVALAVRFWLEFVADHVHFNFGTMWSLPAAHLSIALPALAIGCIAAANTDRAWRKRLLIANALLVIGHAYVMLLAANVFRSWPIR